MQCNKTASGTIAIETDAAGAVTRIALLTGNAPSAPETPVPPGAAEAFRQLAEYFAGKRRNFTLKLRPAGTPFQQKVWRELEKIPYGETRSYSEIAAAIGNPGASRAVGMACHRNPVAIVIPCHRVVGKNGTLTGYAGGIDVKKRLLTLENQNSRRNTESKRS